MYLLCDNDPMAKVDGVGLFSYSAIASNYPTKNAYPTDVNSPNSVWHLIGGKVLVNAKSGNFKNSCAVRLSHALNKSGEIIPFKSGVTSSGRNPPKWWYIFRVAEMKSYLTGRYGAPVVYKSQVKFQKCAPKGILVLDVPGWSDASGHATLWNGKVTIDEAQAEYFGMPNVVFHLWKE